MRCMSGSSLQLCSPEVGFVICKDDICTCIASMLFVLYRLSTVVA